MRQRHGLAWVPMSMRSQTTQIALIISLLGSFPIWAQDPHAGHDMSATSEPRMMHDNKGGADEPMSTGSMQGGSAPPDARNPHAYSGNQDFGPFPLRLGDRQSFASLLVENLELTRSGGNTATAYDLQGWYGRVYDRVVLKAEGDIDGGNLEEARSELLWGHAIASYWDTQLGVRYDSGEGSNRGWLAFGVQGLAPYWFEIDVAGYVGESGRTALRLDASYELLFTQKLILQPRIEADVYGKDDPARGLGSGLAEMSAQLRLRYEVRREFAPYIGVEWVGKFGDTKDLAQAAGEDANDVRLVAGLRFWF